MTTYQARAVRDVNWWAVTVPDLPGVFTQARRLDQVEPMVRDALAVYLDVPGHSFDVSIEVSLPHDLDRAVDTARASATKARDAEAQASIAMRSAAVRLKEIGLTVRDAGRVLGVSPQRISQLVGSRPQSQNQTETPHD